MSKTEQQQNGAQLLAQAGMKHPNGDTLHPITPQPSNLGDISLPAQGVSFTPRSWAELKELSGVLASSMHVPREYRGKPNEVIPAVLMGLELGLNPMTALQNIGVVEGKPTLYGSIVLALARRSPDWMESAYQEWYEVDGQKVVDPYELDADPGKWPTSLRAVCVVQRRSGQPRQESFSVARAMQAGLWMRKSSQGSKMPWAAYPADMLMWKARARAIRPIFADVLMGCPVYEDLRDDRQQEREVNPEPKTKDRSPPTRSQVVLQQGAQQHDLLETVSEAMSKVESEQALKEVSTTDAWKQLNGKTREEARSRYALRLQEIREVNNGES